MIYLGTLEIPRRPESTALQDARQSGGPAWSRAFRLCASGWWEV